MKQMFYGGVHPAEHKEATEQKPIQPLANAPAQVVIPMSMHIGAPCKPVVQKGDTVTVGQKIGETAGLGAPIHASVSGTVVAVEPRPGTGGTPTLSVVIENDFQNTLCPDCKPRENVDALTSRRSSTSFARPAAPVWAARVSPPTSKSVPQWAKQIPLLSMVRSANLTLPQTIV